MTLRHPYLVALLSTLLLLGCDPERPDPNRWFCDAEEVEGDSFVSAGHTFAKGKTRSTERAYQGEASCKVSPTRLYGMSMSLDNPVPGERYAASVWRYNPAGNGVLSVQGQDFFETGKVIDRDGEWALLGIQFTVPQHQTGAMSVGVWIPEADNDSAWFDNLEVGRIAEPTVPEGEEALRLVLDDAAMEKIEAKRAKALDAGILVKEKGDWVRCEVVDDFQYFEAKTRLKGDWTDHLRGKKWSFRIELRNKKEWNGMREFSIQAPETRYNTHEWLWHELLRREDIIATRYDFRHVLLNSTPLGLYAVGEHFGTPLMEAHDRPEGIIMRFDETESWTGILESGESTPPGHAYFEASAIDGYEKPEKNMPEAWAKAREAAMAFKFSAGTASDYFDAEKWAVYMASIDLLGAFHSFHWINLRMYYNPETGLVEPIGFDGFSTDGPEWHGDSKYMGQKIYDDPKGNIFPPYLRYLLNDPELGKRYVDNLRRFTEAGYLESLRDELEFDTERIGELIEPEQPLYRFSWETLLERAAVIREALNADRNMLDQAVAALPHPLPTHILNWETPSIAPQANVSVRAWRHDGTITIACFSPQDVVITGIGSTEKLVGLNPGIQLAGYTNRRQVSVKTMPDQAGAKLYFEPADRNAVFSTPIQDAVPPPFPSSIIER